MLRLVSDARQPVILLEERVERRFLGRTEIARFITRSVTPFPSPARLVVRHTGNRKRTGVEVRNLDGGETAAAVARLLEGRAEFVEAVLPLDFKRFEISHDGEAWVTSIELMGATYVKIDFPAMRSYVRLYPDQREALLATLSVVDSVMAAPET